MSDAGTPAVGIEHGSPAAASLLERADPGHGTPAESREPHPSGTWKVGSLDPTVVKVLTFVGFALPVGAYLALLAHYQVNAILGDQWEDVPTIARSYMHFPDWSSLWAVHTDNRIFFPNLVVIGLAHTVSFNIEVEEWLSALMLLGAVALFIWAHKRRSPATPLFFYCPVAFVMLSFAQWQNTLWGFQMAWYLVLFSLALSVALLDWPRLAWPVFVAAVLVAVVASYSSLQGLLVWPVGLVLLYHRRRPPWAFVSWIVAALATSAFYFRNYHAPHSPPGYPLHHPILVVKFFLFALGDVVGVQMWRGAPGNPAVIAFGAVILVLAIFVVLRWGIRRDESGGVPIGIAMIVFGVLFDALITEGRLVFGVWGATQSRYTTYDVMVLAGIYLTTLSPAPLRNEVNRRAERPEKTKRARPVTSAFRAVVDRRIVVRVALVAMAIQLAFSLHYGLEGARSEHQIYEHDAAVTRNINQESDSNVQLLYFFQPPEWTRRQAAFLRDHHLSLFG